MVCSCEGSVVWSGTRWCPRHGLDQLQLVILPSLGVDLGWLPVWLHCYHRQQLQAAQHELTTNLSLPCCRCSCCLTRRPRPASATPACCTPAAATGQLRSVCLCPPWLITLQWLWATRFSSSEAPCLTMRYVAIVVAAGRGAICGGLLLHFVLLFFFSSSRMCFFVCQPPCLPMSSARPAPPRLQTVTAAVWEFDTLLSTYTPRAAMPAPRTRAGAAAVGGKIYVAGGFASVTEDGGCW